MRITPFVPATEYLDRYGNICHVIRAPAGRLTIFADFLALDSGKPDESAPGATQRPLETLPVDTLVYLLGSRYCETDRLSEFAWSTFGIVRKAGSWCKPSAISCTTISSSATSTPTQL